MDLTTDRTGKPAKISESSIYLWHAVTVNAVHCHPTGGVKSTSPTTENGYAKLYVYSTNINTSDEDKHDTNYINKNDSNTYTRKLHN